MKEKDIKQVYPFPPLTEEEFAELKEDIAERGVMIPIEVDEAGAIIDGYHRFRACRELGITDIPFICREGWSDAEKRTQAIKLNMARRHLTREQKREFIRELIKETPEKSDRQIADALGVHHTTVGTVRKDLVGSGDVANLATSIDTLGREQPRQRKPAADNPQAREDMGGLTGTPAPAMQDPKAQESSTKDDPYVPPRTMTSAEDLLMALKDEADGEDRVLRVLLDDYKGNTEKEGMLFSDAGIKAGREGLAVLKGVIEKYEELIESRK